MDERRNQRLAPSLPLTLQGEPPLVLNNHPPSHPSFMGCSQWSTLSWLRPMIPSLPPIYFFLSPFFCCATLPIRNSAPSRGRGVVKKEGEDEKKMKKKKKKEGEEEEEKKRKKRREKERRRRKKKKETKKRNERKKEKKKEEEKKDEEKEEEERKEREEEDEREEDEKKEENDDDEKKKKKKVEPLETMEMMKKRKMKSKREERREKSQIWSSFFPPSLPLSTDPKATPPIPSLILPFAAPNDAAAAANANDNTLDAAAEANAAYAGDADDDADADPRDKANDEDDEENDANDANVDADEEEEEEHDEEEDDGDDEDDDDEEDEDDDEDENNDDEDDDDDDEDKKKKPIGASRPTTVVGDQSLQSGATSLLTPFYFILFYPKGPTEGATKAWQPKWHLPWHQTCIFCFTAWSSRGHGKAGHPNGAPQQQQCQLQREQLRAWPTMPPKQSTQQNHLATNLKESLWEWPSPPNKANNFFNTLFILDFIIFISTGVRCRGQEPTTSHPQGATPIHQCLPGRTLFCFILFPNSTAEGAH